MSKTISVDTVGSSGLTELTRGLQKMVSLRVLVYVLLFTKNVGSQKRTEVAPH